MSSGFRFLSPDLAFSSASSVPLRFKGFDFPITAITRDVGDSAISF
jgi:hypothetical protein